MACFERRHRRLWMLAVPVLLGSGPLFADEEADDSFDRTPQDCVQLRSVRDTEVLDDQTIVFVMRGRDKAYRNFLPRKCPGLARSERFSHVTRSGRLCSVDLITVLEQFGASLQPGFTCKLGQFYPMSPEEIADLRVRKKGDAPSRDAIETEPAELPPEERTNDEGSAPTPVGN